MQAQQLKRLKYEQLDYGRYEKLKEIYLKDDFDPNKQEELELINCKAQDIPFKPCLEILTNLKALILSQNSIAKFSYQIILKCLPHLQVLDLSYNKIDGLEDLVELGTMQDLNIIDFSNNPLCAYLTRINILEELLCPKKYAKYDAVKILTAGYIKIPTGTSKFEQSQENRRVIERLPEELEPKELRVTVSKYNHKNTLGKYSQEQCPIPRKTRFPNLVYLNGSIVTKLDIIRITGVNDFKEMLVNTQDHKQDKKKKLVNPKNQAYLDKYLKRIKRDLEKHQDQFKMDVQKHDATSNNQVEDILNYLAQRDKMETLQNQVTYNRKKFSKELWEKPIDIQYKDAEFQIGIEDFKQQDKEWQKQIEDKKKKANPEEDKGFRKKIQRQKPKLDLQKKDEANYRSSESSLSENGEPIKSISDVSDKESNLSESEEKFESKRKRKLDKDYGQSAKALKGQLITQEEDKKPSSHRKIAHKKQTYKEQAAPLSEENEEDNDSAQNSGNNLDPQFNPGRPKNRHSQPKQPANKLLVEEMKNDDRDTFNVQNKIFYGRELVYKNEIDDFKNNKIKNLAVQQEKLNKMYKEDEILLECERLKNETTQVVKPNRSIHREPEVEHRQNDNLQIHLREFNRVIVKGNLDKQEFKKREIEIDTLVPSEEQGIPSDVKMNYLFDQNGPQYKQLSHYKKLIEDNQNIREECKELDQKLVIQGLKQNYDQKEANNFDTVFNYLKQDKNFQIQKCQDVGDTVVQNYINKKNQSKSKQNFNSKAKITTHDLRDIIYGANEYQKEKNIKEGDIIQMLENDKNLTPEQRKKLYDWLEILDDIKLKQSKIDEQRIKRLEKKEIEKAESLAHLYLLNLKGLIIIRD